MNDERGSTATPSQTVGPFFHVAFTPQPRGGVAAAADGGDRIRLRITVTDGDGKPVDDAVLELWHTSTATTSAPFARMLTGGDGACELETVWPGPAAAQASHINVCLFARGLLRQLHTRIYFAGDPALHGDAVMTLVPEERRGTLLARSDPHDATRWLFDVRLQGPHETVFFDP